MKYIKKPEYVEAIQWLGHNNEEIEKFAEDNCEFVNQNFLFIFTGNESIRASLGDYIVKGVNGQFFPYKPDNFRLHYDKL